MYGHPFGIKYFGYLGTVERVNYTKLFWNSLRNWGKPSKIQSDSRTLGLPNTRQWVEALDNVFWRKVDVHEGGSFMSSQCVYLLFCVTQYLFRWSDKFVRSFLMLQCPRQVRFLVYQLLKLVSIIAHTPFFCKLRTILAETAPPSIHHPLVPRKTDRPGGSSSSVLLTRRDPPPAA